MLRDPLIAAVRTGCAALVTFLIAWLANTLGAEFPEGTATQMQAVVFVVAVGLVNLAVNFLAAHVSPIFGVLLGVPKAPTYDGTKPAGDAGMSVVELCYIVIAVSVAALALVAVFGKP